jgi:hypothetical protein
MLISTLICFFDRSFHPQLDQMEHRSIHHPASYRLHLFGVRNTISVLLWR